MEVSRSSWVQVGANQESYCMQGCVKLWNWLVHDSLPDLPLSVYTRSKEVSSHGTWITRVLYGRELKDVLWDTTNHQGTLQGSPQLEFHSGCASDRSEAWNDVKSSRMTWFTYHEKYFSPLKMYKPRWVGNDALPASLFTIKQRWHQRFYVNIRGSKSIRRRQRWRFSNNPDLHYIVDQLNSKWWHGKLQ